MSLSKNILSTFLTQFPVQLLGIISGILITRALGPEGKGLYAIFFTNNILFTLLFSFSINIGIVHFVSKNEYKLNEIISISFLVVIVSVLLFVFFLFITYFFFDNNVFLSGELALPKYYMLQALFFIFSILITVITAIFNGLKRFKEINNISIFTSVITLLFYIVFFFNAKHLVLIEKIDYVLYITVLISMIISIVWIIQYIKKIGVLPQFKYNRKLFRLMFSFIIIGYLSNLINSLNYRLDIWVVNYYVSIKDVGLYSLAVNFSQLLWMISIPISIVLQPHLNSLNKSDSINKFAVFSRINTTLIVIGAMAIFLIVDFIVPYIYGYEFKDSVMPVKILLLGIVFSGITKVFAVMFIINNKIKYNLYATIVGLVFTVILDFILIPNFGIIGASIATSISYLSIFVAIIYFFIKKLNIPLRNYFIFKRNDINIINKTNE